MNLKQSVGHLQKGIKGMLNLGEGVNADVLAMVLARGHVAEVDDGVIYIKVQGGRVTLNQFVSDFGVSMRRKWRRK